MSVGARAETLLWLLLSGFEQAAGTESGAVAVLLLTKPLHWGLRMWACPLCRQMSLDSDYAANAPLLPCSLINLPAISGLLPHNGDTPMRFMFFGADVTHPTGPAKGNLPQKDSPDECSIACLTGSMDQVRAAIVCTAVCAHTGRLSPYHQVSRHCSRRDSYRQSAVLVTVHHPQHVRQMRSWSCVRRI